MLENTCRRQAHTQNSIKVRRQELWACMCVLALAVLNVMPLLRNKRADLPARRSCSAPKGVLSTVLC
eukprot:190165-Chlamydomonas_euryale.AAC.1